MSQRLAGASLRGGYEDRAAGVQTADDVAWIVNVLAGAVERHPPARRPALIAKANDVLEQLHSAWRLTALGDPHRVGDDA